MRFTATTAVVTMATGSGRALKVTTRHEDGTERVVFIDLRHIHEAGFDPAWVEAVGEGEEPTHFQACADVTVLEPIG